MKWITHQAGALAAALWFKAEPLVSACMVLGAVLPDIIEQGISRRNARLFLAIHRGFFHWFGLYAAGLLAAICLPLASHEKMAAVGLMLGALSHIALDALNPSGVPALPLHDRPRLKLPLVSTGSLGEWGILAGLLTLIALGGYRLDARWLKKLAHFFG
ncbi:MAG: metal-dependent hydrolase [Deltaproteobacteria bacterium]|jgi:inner membrane protein|nr:metal-dependent hydrolase [Deltaproteobacteria bacterium]